MTRVEWEGIPERYWPDTEKPWRVSWGFGCFEDFATEAEAQALADKLRADKTGGWDALVQDPFNAVEIIVS